MIDLSDVRPDPDLVRVLPRAFAVAHRVVVVTRAADRLVIALADPLNVVVLDDVRLHRRGPGDRRPGRDGEPGHRPDHPGLRQRSRRSRGRRRPRAARPAAGPPQLGLHRRAGADDRRRGRPGGAARQRDPLGRPGRRRERRPHRAAATRTARPLPRRRGAPRRHGGAARRGERRREPPEDHGRAGHRGAASARRTAARTSGSTVAPSMRG